jgi:hypothetical protein
MKNLPEEKDNQLDELFSQSNITSTNDHQVF